MDLVLNHVAREHEWAEKARAGEQRYRDYFHIHPDRTQPDAWEATLPEVFPDFAPGNFTWDDEVAGWVWTTFNEWQWDLDWANGEVLVEYADIVLFLANLGVEVLRLDAIAFLWKRLGTNCQNQPEVHAITQVLRTVARLAAPGARLQGRGDRRPARPRAVPRPRPARRPDQRPRLPQQPDGAGLVDAGHPRHRARPARPRRAAADADHRHLDHLRPLPRRHRLGDRRPRRRRGRAERRTTTAASWPTGTPATSRAPGAEGLVFQHNPATGDKRISGTAASLNGPRRRPATTRRWPGCSSPTPSSPAGAASR